jgi:AGZA family xanthine/uracil permease-like MFS transporter
MPSSIAARSMPASPWTGTIDRFFGVSERGSTFGREILAGLTTFAAMSYIIVVNPAILATTGMNKDALVVATIVASILGTLAVGLRANLPVALAPGMGVNSIFASLIVAQLGVSWQTALALVFTTGLLFLAVSLTRLRLGLVASFPPPIKIGIQCAIGVFIAYVGLTGSGIVVGHPTTLIALGHLANPGTALALAGVLATPVLFALRIPGAILIAIITVTVACHLVPGAVEPVAADSSGHLIALPQIPRDLLFAFDFGQFRAQWLLLLPVLLYLLVITFLDTTATLIAVARRADVLTSEGDIRQGRAAFACCGLAICGGAALGTSPVVSYVESLAGVEAGGRTGLTALVVAALFAAALFLWPVVALVPPQATAAALVMVGLLMLHGLREIDYADPVSAVPPLITVLFTIATSDLLAGIAAGTLLYTLLLLATRQLRSVTPGLVVLDAVLVLYLALTATVA